MRKGFRSFIALTATALTATGVFVAASNTATAAPTAQYLYATGAGPGGGPHVRVFKGDGTATSVSFYAYGQSFPGGVEVAMGDLDGDGAPEIITGAGAGGGPHVRVFTINGAPIDKWGFFAFGDTFSGGVHVGAADTDGDGKDEVIVGAGAGGGPHVKIFRIEGDKAVEKESKFAFPGTFSGGVNVAGIDNNEAGNKDSVLVGAGAGGGPHVKVLSPTLGDTAGWFAYGGDYAGGVSVAAYDLNADGTDEVLTGSLGFAGHVKSFSTAGVANAVSFFAFPNTNRGVHVGSFAKSGLGSPILGGAVRSGHTNQFSAGGVAIAPVAPYGAGFAGGVFIAGGYGLFEDTPPAGTLTITTESLPGGSKDAAYTTTLAATGGTGALTWSISAGTLPAGLTLAPSTGIISGTPTASGTSNFTVKVVDASTPTPKEATKALSIVITDGLTVTSAAALPDGLVGSSYNDGAGLTAAGGTPPYTWAVTTGNLPTGLTLNPETGAITGTPANAGTASFTVTVTDASTPAKTATKAVTLKVVEPVAIPTSTDRPDGVVGEQYATTIAATGGTPGYLFTLTQGTLPAGLELDEDTGVISGTPTTEQSKTFTIEASDAANPARTAEKQFNISIYSALVIQTQSLDDGKVGTIYSDQIDVDDTGNGPYTYSIASGALPAGLSLNATTGAITGTPTAAGDFTFKVKVVDSSTPAQQFTSSDYEITIAP